MHSHRIQEYTKLSEPNNGMQMAGRYPAVPLNELLFLTYGAAHSGRGSIRPPLKPGVIANESGIVELR